MWIRRLGRVIEPDELVSIAYVALCNAATAYDPGRGASFRTYAGSRIDTAICDEARRRIGRKGIEKPTRIPYNALSSLDALNGVGYEAPADDHPLEDVDSRDFVDRVLAQLPERERFCLTMYTHGELNQRELGEILGVSESRVSQIIRQAGDRIRKADRRSCNDPRREGRLARPRMDPQ